MAAGCGGDDDEAGGAGTTAAETGGAPEGMQQSIGEGEGRVDLIIWAGYAEDGTTDPKVDWVTDFEKKTGCQVNSKVGDDLGRDGDADAHRQLRRRLGVRRRDAAADRRGRRRPGEHRPARELRRRLRGAQEQAAQLRRRPDVRRSPRPRRQPADVAHGQGDAGADQLERRLGGGLAVQGQDHGVRQPDLHRGRRPLPDEDPARSRDQEPVRARRRPVPGRRRPAQAAAGEHRRVLVGLRRRRSRPSRAAAPSSGRRGSTRPTSSPARRLRSRRRCPRRARPGGRTPG